MSSFAVIVQNDESQWDDVKGDLYNYPATYRNILTKGCNVIYYNGKLTDKQYKDQRLSSKPHYFGVGVVGDSIADSDSSKNDYYCEILEYQEFTDPVLAKLNNEYLETIPESRESNYWRFGVREIREHTYQNILKLTSLTGHRRVLPSINGEFESFGGSEGQSKQRYTTYFERHKYYRNKAIEIHGLSCMVCDFNFEQEYGNFGKGFIHVHHNKPISETGPTKINPQTDMSVLCPNCHAMIHHKKNNTLAVEELRIMLANSVT